MGMIASYEHPVAGKVKVVAPAVKMSGKRRRPSTAPHRWSAASTRARYCASSATRMRRSMRISSAVSRARPPEAEFAVQEYEAGRPAAVDHHQVAGHGGVGRRRGTDRFGDFLDMGGRPSGTCSMKPAIRAREGTVLAVEELPRAFGDRARRQRVDEDALRAKLQRHGAGKMNDAGLRRHEGVSRRIAATPTTEAMLTMRPWPRATISCSTAWLTT